MSLRPELTNLWGLRRWVLNFLIWAQKGSVANIIANSNKWHNAHQNFVRCVCQSMLRGGARITVMARIKQDQENRNGHWVLRDLS